MSRGDVDVVVTDGFSGNIALKTAEGTARFVTDLLRRAFTSSLRSKAGFALSRPALNLLKHHLDPNNHNGAVFLGLNGLVVKSHGSANAKGVANAIRVAARMVRNDITRKIGEDLDNFRAHAFANEAAQVSRRSVIARHRQRRCRRARSPTTSSRETVDTTDEWIVERTGIRSRYIAGEGETTGDASPPTPRAGRSTQPASTRREIDLIVLATATPDQTFPSSATKVQAALGIDDCIAFDVARGLHRLPLRAVGRRFDAPRRQCRQGAGDRRRDLQPDPRLGGPRDLRPVRRRRRRAGARAPRRRDSGILATRLHADGRHNDLLFVDGGPSTTGTVGKLRMKGREVFRHAVVNLAEVLNEVLDAAGLTPADVDWVVPHQANARILDATAKKLGLPPEKVVVTVDRHANTSAASVPLALDTAVRTAGSSAATWSCSKRWAVALPGARQRSGIEKFGISGKCRIADRRNSVTKV